MLPFQVLSELAININRNKVKQIDILREAGNDQKRVNKLYNGLLKKKYLSDEDAAKDIFGTDESNIQYRKLRLKLFDMLVNTAFFTDGNLAKFPEATKAQFQCYRYFAAANILISVTAQDAAAYLLKRVLEKAIKFELTSLAAEVSWILRTQIINYINKKELAKYAAINEKYEFKRKWEMEATIAYEDLIQFYMANRTTNYELHKKFEPIYLQLSSKLEEIDTVQFYYLTYSIGVAHLLAGNDCENALELCLKALEILEKRGGVLSWKLLSFCVNALFCYTQLKITEKSKTQKIINQCYNLSPEFSANRIIILDKILHHHLYAGRYREALEIYETAINHTRFSFLRGTNMEIWKIYAGYFQFLANIGILEREEVATITSNFDIDLIDYAVKEFKKEKEGMNIPIVMLPVLVGVLEKQIEGHVRTKDALVQYAKRYLKKQKNKKTNEVPPCSTSSWLLRTISSNKKHPSKSLKRRWRFLNKSPLNCHNNLLLLKSSLMKHLWH